jgi:hypothetical protein
VRRLVKIARDLLLPDLMTIADKVDAQLSRAVAGMEI